MQLVFFVYLLLLTFQHVRMLRAFYQILNTQSLADSRCLRLSAVRTCIITHHHRQGCLTSILAIPRNRARVSK